MLGLVLRGLVALALAATVVAIAVDYLDKEIAREKIKDKLGEDALGAIIKNIVRCGSITKVNFKDLESDKDICIEADEVSDDIQEGDVIYI